METNTAQEKSTRVASSGEQNGLTRLTSSNPQQRSEHVQAFLEWLPRMLHEAPTIHWESLPSIVMRYLIRHVANEADIIPLSLAVGTAMNGMREKPMYGVCRNTAGLLRRLRKEYEVSMLTDLSQRGLWYRFVEGRVISSGDLKKLK